MIIASVRYDEQRLLCVVCSFHLAEAQVDAIEQRGLSARRSKHQMILQFLHAAGEGARQLRAIVEIDQQKFVLRIRGAEELHGRQARFLDLVGHAAAHVENHADRNRHIFAGETHDFLLDVVFEYAEILLLQPGDQSPVGIRHRYVHQRDVGFGLERFALLDFLGIINVGGPFNLRPDRSGQNKTLSKKQKPRKLAAVVLMQPAAVRGISTWPPPLPRGLVSAWAVLTGPCAGFYHPLDCKASATLSNLRSGATRRAPPC